jgi:hypothetical protein
MDRGDEQRRDGGAFHAGILNAPQRPPTARALQLTRPAEEGVMRGLWLTLLILSTVLLGGCEVVGGIFKAGMWVGIIMVVLILAGVAFLVAKLRR